MKKQIIVCLLAVCLLLSGCSGSRQYTITYLDLFDTVTTLVGSAPSEAEFNEQALAIREKLEYYHRLFDIYNSYEGLNNLKTVNDSAGIAPVPVDGEIIRFLKDCICYYDFSGGRVNIAMGSVLKLWHQARSDSLENPDSAYIPTRDELTLAAAHTDIGCIQIDENASTVYISDPLVQLDVGAIAKGWAVQQAAQAAPAGILISVGGNVCATGAKDGKETPWVIGIQHPRQTDGLLHTVALAKGCLVTSGDYQRAFTVDGVSYHHIIDPQTLMPASGWCSVTVLHQDSATADALSTALFLMPLEEGKALAESLGAEALWVDTDGEGFMTAGFAEAIQ